MKNITDTGNNTSRSDTESGSIITGAMKAGSGHHINRARSVTVMIATEKAVTVTGTVRIVGTSLSAVPFLCRPTTVNRT
jgi:hypothetical protein